MTSIGLAARARIVQAPALPPAQAAGTCMVPPQSGREHAPQFMAAAPRRAVGKNTWHKAPHSRWSPPWRPVPGIRGIWPARLHHFFYASGPPQPTGGYWVERGCMSPGVEV